MSRISIARKNIHYPKTEMSVHTFGYIPIFVHKIYTTYPLHFNPAVGI